MTKPASVPNPGGGSRGMGAMPPCKRSEAAPAFSIRRHVGSLDAAAAVRLPLRPAAP